MSKKKPTLAVVGIGYVGLPLALLAAEKKWRVIGIDINKEKVSQVNSQEMPFKDDIIAEQLRRFPIEASSDFSRVSEAQVVVVAVPTPVKDTHIPDLAPLISAVTGIRPYLQAGQVLVVESTINPGVMDEVVLPILRERKDLILDSDSNDASALRIAHCPERINPGDKKWTVRNIPRVLGGYTPTGTQAAREFYESIIEAPIKPLASIQEAEACKILENTFRDVNIAFINEMAKSFQKLNIDILHVIEGAATKPFAFMPHYPGNGVGGHCISVDPYYMIERGRLAGFDHIFLKMAREINNGMPAYAVNLLHRGCETAHLPLESLSVALLGLAYKKNIDDLRESPAIEIMHMLKKAYPDVKVYDPFAPSLSTVASLEEATQGVSAVMLATDHTEFVETLTPAYLKSHGIKIVIDGRNALDGISISKQGIYYYGIGRQYLPV